MHVVVPLTPGHSWRAHKDFAHCFAEALAIEEHPFPIRDIDPLQRCASDKALAGWGFASQRLPDL